VLHSPVGFDLTVTSLHGVLAAGGCVTVAALAPGLPPAAFLKVTPSHLAVLPSGLVHRGELVVGGEALLGEPLGDWRRRHPDVTVVNEYGPTEATVGCILHRVGPGEPVPVGGVPIGRPAPGTRAYVLDARLRPVPVGVPGELYLAGDQLARGYLGQPGQTADRFVPDPYGPAGTRMYRTGDRARLLADGTLEYLGRTDSQVKVRGFRVEPGELEAALAEEPGLAQVAVAVREDPAGGTRLVGYAVAEPGAAPDAEAVRARLAGRLPGYLVPAAVVLLDALPLTPNGKVDRRALPDPAGTRRRAGRPPRTAVEEVLCSLLAEVLGVGEVGADESWPWVRALLHSVYDQPTPPACTPSTTRSWTPPRTSCPAVAAHLDAVRADLPARLGPRSATMILSGCPQRDTYQMAASACRGRWWSRRS
jgi:hypothetical protein